MNMEKLKNSVASAAGFGIAGFFTGTIYAGKTEPVISGIGILAGVVIGGQSVLKQSRK